MPGRQRREQSEEAAGAGSAPRPAASILALQRDAGNQQFSRFLGAPDASAAVAATLQKQEELLARLRPAVHAYLEQQKVNLITKLPYDISMPEIVDMVRTNVPDATQLSVGGVASLVREVFGGHAIPAHRLDRKGLQAEMAASLRNALGNLPTELKIVDNGSGYLRLKVTGIEARIGAVRASATPGEARVEMGSGKAGIAATATAKDAYAGTRFGLEGNIGPVHLAGALIKNSRGEWANWTFSLGLPELDPTDPAFGDVAQTMTAAVHAMGEIARSVQAGVNPTDPVLIEHLDVVKAGMDTIAKLAKDRDSRPRIGVGVQVEGKDRDIRAMATVTLRF